MPQYVGYSSINALVPRSTELAVGTGGGVGTVTSPVIPGKRYRLTDEQLVIQDLVNAFNIRQGEKVGQPQYGTSLWSFIFEPNTLETQQELEAEIRRVAGQDPRLEVNSVITYEQDQGILVEVEIAVAPFNNPQIVGIMFDRLTNGASLV